MALEDYYFNEPLYIAHRRQEFYATGLFADAVRGAFPPGFFGEVKIGQLPANETVSAAYKVADVYNNSLDFDLADFVYGLYDRDDGTPGNITMAGGSTRPFESTKSYALPYIQPYAGTGDPRGTWQYLSGRVTDSFGLGLGVGNEMASNFGLDFNNMAMLSGLTLVANLNRLPATVSTFAVEGEWVLELPSIFYVQLDLTPPDSFSESLGRLYHAGWLAFGHL